MSSSFPVQISWVLIAMLRSVASTQDLVSIQAQHPCIDPLSSTGLSEAVDAAIVSLLGQSGWLHNLRQTSGYVHPIEVTSCTPTASMWTWPSAVDANGMLARVLAAGEIRVAGVQWKKGGAADYKTNSAAPTGFWPEYMNSIATQIETHYGKTIKVKRVYYANSDLVIAAVANGTDVDMSEPYYYLSGFHDSQPRIEALGSSCVTVATSSAFSSTAASGISSMDELYNKIVAGPNRKVGFIGAGNYDAVSHVLPTNTEPTYITDSTELEGKVDDGTLLASYISESTASTAGNRAVYESGVISPRVAFFRKDTVAECVHKLALSDSQVAATTCATIKDEDNTLHGIVVIVLASVALLLTLILGFLIIKERSGKPVFYKPLLSATSGPRENAIGIGNSACSFPVSVAVLAT